MPRLNKALCGKSLMKVLITGSEGFVGRHLREYLGGRGYVVVGADISSGADIRMDVTDFDSVLKTFEQNRFEAVVHLAAVADIPLSMRDPHRCFKVNVYGSLNVLEAARRIGVRRVVVFSSANYYGAPVKLPVTEDTPPNPRTPYDYSKVALENVAWSYHRNHGVPITVLRPWKAFGEYEPGEKMVPRFVKACLASEPIPLFNGGADVTDPYHVDNLCHAVELGLIKDEAVGEAFNVGTGNALSVRELAEKIKQLTNSSSKLETLPPRTPAEATPMKSIPSIKKIATKLGYTPQVSLEQGLKRVINFIASKQQNTNTGR
uniref:UDP-glucose 4-epimerase n=1 Tax=Caldiarchaeum subterraneum TaxID=311458 RepID=E6N9Z6_CALS0|nr:UDP-glucose 4-epimerase [Candidatus Caldarchaeum subterraneum]